MGSIFSSGEASYEYKEIKVDKDKKDFPETRQGSSVLEKKTFDIAVTGVSGVGKSSLINSLRGLSDFDMGAAKIDVIQATTEPVAYLHPAFPNVTIWDLPGNNPFAFSAEEYLQRINYSQYDFFIIVSSYRFTAYDIQLSRAILKAQKHFYFVCSKMDVLIQNKRRNPNFDEEKTLQWIRAKNYDYLVRTGISSPAVFFVSNWYWDKYDFPLLQSSLENKIKGFEKRASIAEKAKRERSTETSSSAGVGAILADRIMRRYAAAQRNPEEMVKETHRELEALENTKLDIAITGVSGAGKSSLVNALRNMTDYEEGAAQTGVLQTTMDIHGYPHPLFPNVTLWDLPGIGTPEFRPNVYLKKVNFTRYDFFIIVASDRFGEHDVLLAHEIRKIKKKYYYVRSKTDLAIESERRRPNFNENKTLEKIREYFCESLRKAGEPSPRVFLISRWHLNRYDFPLLQETLGNELDDLKRHALILALPVFSREILEKKKAAMEKVIWRMAILSCGVGALPVPGLSLVCDIGILVTTLQRFYSVFGLDEASLHRVANTIGKDYEVLRSVIKKSPMSSEITPEFVIGLLTKSLLCGTLMVLELVFDFVPVMGSLVGAGSSFFTTFYMLKNFLRDIVEDAENVRAAAAGS